MKKNIVIKIGSSILMNQHKKLDEFRVTHIAEQVLKLQFEGLGVVLVVSGAVASGFNFVNFEESDENLRMAAAGIGQAILTSTFQQIFALKKLQIAQVLLNQENLIVESDRDKVNKLLLFYLNSGFVPLVNENDVISMNSFGGNDILASEIASLISAKKLLILSTYDKSFFGIGGGETKEKTLKEMKARKIQARILDGKHKNIILEAVL